MTVAVQTLHDQATVVVAHDHMLYSIAARRARGQRSVFSGECAPLARQGGVNVFGLVVGGDPPPLGGVAADPWWGSLTLLDMLWQEAEERSDTMSICLDCQKIDEAVAEGKVAVVATMESASALGESAHPQPLVRLRMLYRLGLRGLQFLGQGWNQLRDAHGQDWPSRGLTPFGKDVVREMNRLGMVIDLAHVPDPDPLVWKVIEISHDPIAVSEERTTSQGSSAMSESR